MHGLSCYTASLHEYLAREWDASTIIALTVRLAIRVDPPDGQLAFSHHEPSLDRLPDGTWLSYAAAESPAAALPEVMAALDTHGRAIVVTDSSLLPWSVLYGGPPSPHWLLLDGSGGGRWHASDPFSALLPAGQQQPYDGWLDTRQLAEAMTLPARWAPEQEARNALAFGAAVKVPAGGACWLRRHRDRPAAAGLAGRWLTGTNEALRFLAEYLTRPGAGLERYLDDIWAAAGHHSFAYRWRLSQRPGDEQAERALRLALGRWNDLPRLLRTATASAQRGRPRPTLIRAAIGELAQAEEGLP